FSRNVIASSIGNAVKSVMLKLLILQLNIFLLRRLPSQVGHLCVVTTLFTSSKKRFFSKLSFNKNERLKRCIKPSNLAVFGQLSGGFFNFLGFVYKNVSISSFV